MPVPRTPEELDAWRLLARQAAEAYLESRHFTRGQGDSWLGAVDVPLTPNNRSVPIAVLLPGAFPDAVPIITVLDATIPKPMAHVESAGRLCLIQAHTATLDTSRPAEILREALGRAITILTDGLTGCSDGELFDEFLAYWGRGVSEPAIHSLVTTTGDMNVARSIVLFRVRMTEKAKPEIYLADSWSQMKQWASRRGAALDQDHRAVFLLPIERPVRPPDFDTPPPLRMWLAGLREAASPDVWNRFEGWLAQVSLPAIIVQSIPSRTTSIPTLALLELDRASSDQRRALREKQGRRSHDGRLLTAAVELDTTADQPIHRRLLTRIDADYLTRRGGAASLGNKRVVIVGCGAVGAQVATQLARVGVGTLVLVDPEKLEPENVHRHICGLFFAGRNKAHGLKHWLELNYPHQSVEAFSSDYETVWRRASNVFAEADLVIFATGDEMVERRATALMAAKSRIHTWVEPMGIGGHALGVVPRNDGVAAGCYECLFQSNDDGLICNTASLAAPNQHFGRTLAGCAGFHTPFSALDAERSAIEASSVAVAILLGEVTASRLITWRGSTDTFLSGGFSLSPRGHVNSCAREEIYADTFADAGCQVCRLAHESQATTAAILAADAATVASVQP